MGKNVGTNSTKGDVYVKKTPRKTMRNHGKPIGKYGDKTPRKHSNFFMNFIPTRWRS